MFDATNIQAWSVLAGVLVTLVAAVTALIATLRGNTTLSRVEQNTNGTLAVMAANNAQLRTTQATDGEMASRAAVPAMPSALHLLPGPPAVARGG